MKSKSKSTPVTQKKGSQIIVKILLLFLFINVSYISFAQEEEKETDKTYHFSGIVTATNNGISIIPSFSLGKPALMFELSMGTEKIHFDPQFRFSMEGKPWAFVFWWRYQMYKSENFSFNLGAHPAFMFVDLSYEKDGRSIESIEARRYVAAEFSPVFKISKKVSILPYSIVAHGFDEGVQNTLYLTLITSVNDLKLGENLRFGLIPQAFFLKMDDDHGFYAASSFSLSHIKSPVSLEAMFNAKIKSDIPSDDFLWNVSLVYRFRNTFSKR